MTLDLSYIERKNKQYRHPLPNAKRKPSERRSIYQKLREHGFTPKQARQIRDWHI